MKKLSKAVMHDDRDAAMDLLAKGADPNEQERVTRSTPLTHASAVGNAEMVRLLLSHGGDLGWTGGLAGSAIHCAGNAQTAQVLLDAGADVDLSVGSHHRTPLHVAVEEARVDVVDLLLKRGADVNAVTEKQQTPLDLAVLSAEYQGSERHAAFDEIVARLAGAGGVRRKATSRERSSIAKARREILSGVQHGDLTRVDALVSSREGTSLIQDQEALDQFLAFALAGDTVGASSVEMDPFRWAIGGHRMAGAHVELALKFIALGANVNKRAPVSLTAQGLDQLWNLSEGTRAWESGPALTLVGAMFETHPFVASPVGVTPVFYATINDSAELVDALVAAGADPMARTVADQTPLHWAVLFGASRAAARLIEAGADVHAADLPDGRTPVDWAARRLSDRRLKGDARRRTEDVSRLLAARGAST